MKQKILINVNTFTSFLFGFTFLLCMTSCNDFLEVPPKSKIDPEFLIVDSLSAETALTGIYNILNASDVNGEGNAATFRRNMLYLLNGGTDETVPNSNQVLFQPYLTYTYNDSDVMGREAWLFFYAGIKRANFFLAKIEAIEFEGEIRKTEQIAEARFLRGIYYQYLAWLYGGVPIIKSSNGSDADSLSRASLEEVYSQIEEDLLFAYQNLPLQNAKAGRADKWSAAGYLSKMYLYLASAKENNIDRYHSTEINTLDWVESERYYQKGYEINSAIIGQKQLVENYIHLFRAETNQETYGEVLFGVEATNNQDVIMIYVNGFIPQGNINTNGGGYGIVRPSVELINQYHSKDGRFQNNVTGNITNQSTKENFFGVEYFMPTPINPSKTNISVGKWRQPVPGSYPLEPWASPCNFQLIRYADILLMQAEYEVKVNANETIARNYLREVRRRAANGDEQLTNELTFTYKKYDVMEEIRAERSRELCYEGWRKLDLIRWGIMEETINGLTLEGSGFQSQMQLLKSNFSTYKIWLPIPSTELILNTNLTQNSGY
ncbi:RagB/SusD family nutrient uptake outer membrane protein [Flammeovirga sp. EKP202]|uniref:RagB/SusD family nutrient uptake outer membrane protein n=1 Tax=Flammeovirga sp. EKP202 TaxID=2770592 RepID=UPI00165FB5FC|nr:RagB/SusD family nutrient uptake outer membrane protein [Flammeovirga sp. EKP202]MBD0404312.1 RagB/SusD family nutrient uptake outer membrane protein [Flammeovirga sp. EKP202]